MNSGIKWWIKEYIWISHQIYNNTSFSTQSSINTHLFKKTAENYTQIKKIPNLRNFFLREKLNVSF